MCAMKLISSRSWVWWTRWTSVFRRNVDDQEMSVDDSTDSGIPKYIRPRECSSVRGKVDGALHDLFFTTQVRVVVIQELSSGYRLGPCCIFVGRSHWGAAYWEFYIGRIQIMQLQFQPHIYYLLDWHK
ncbi:hypothetical protein PR003_g33175 [Phytophthora rubi]|uniref:Uncharacterized protein n=2 Tax=Phytophthora rubi TaxID=129364 RepID=A0A6A4ASX6_9STRA|nr:hypothetical protein PR003_g33175 [Phytophthora rubi]